jgi:hypothetical protein
MNRVQRTRTKGAKLPPHTLCVTRGTLFGNPIKKKFAREGNQRVVAEFREWVYQPQQAKLRKDFIWACKTMDIEHLACWCNINDECHADVWLEIFNESQLPFTDSSRIKRGADKARMEAGG